MMFTEVLAVFLHLPSDKRSQLTFFLLKHGRGIPFSSPQPFVVLSDNILCSQFNPQTSQLFESFLQTFHQSLTRWFRGEPRKSIFFLAIRIHFPHLLSVFQWLRLLSCLKSCSFAALPFINLTQAWLCTHSPQVSFELAEWRAGDLENADRKQKQSSGVGKEQWSRHCKLREAGGSKKQEQWTERVGGEVNRIKIKSEEKLIHSAEPCAVLFFSQCQRVCSSYC